MQGQSGDDDDYDDNWQKDFPENQIQTSRCGIIDDSGGRCRRRRRRRRAEQSQTGVVYFIHRRRQFQERRHHDEGEELKQKGESNVERDGDGDAQKSVVPSWTPTMTKSGIWSVYGHDGVVVVFVAVFVVFVAVALRSDFREKLLRKILNRIIGISF